MYQWDDRCSDEVDSDGEVTPIGQIDEPFYAAVTVIEATVNNESSTVGSEKETVDDDDNTGKPLQRGNNTI